MKLINTSNSLYTFAKPAEVTCQLLLIICNHISMPELLNVAHNFWNSATTKRSKFGKHEEENYSHKISINSILRCYICTIMATKFVYKFVMLII